MLETAVMLSEKTNILLPKLDELLTICLTANNVALASKMGMLSCLNHFQRPTTFHDRSTAEKGKG